MARPIRVEVAGGLYHVIVRGNERKAVFRDDSDRGRYLERVAHYREKFGFQLLAYCLLDNHVHLAIETGKIPLSRIMAGLQSSYTQYFNRRHERVGHLFQGRYKAFLVEEDPYALALLRYIHENPVKARIAGRPEQYAWSSDRFYRRGKGPEWLDLVRIGVSHGLLYCWRLMARPLRLEVPGGLYHVIVRGNERRNVFRDDSDRVRYLERLAFYRGKFGFQLLAYCLMDNHVHLAIEIGKAPLSRIMAGLQSSYTQYFNRRHDRAGHLFQRRYKAFLVEEDPYALGLIRYIHENPVRARAVGRPEDHPWSSDRHYRKGKGPEWLDLDRGLRMLGGRRSMAVRAYRRLMREEVAEPYEELTAWGQMVKGGEAFAERALQAVGEPRRIRKGLRVEEVAREVGRLDGRSLSAMRSASRARELSRARLLTALLGRQVGGISITRTARYFGRDPSTMARGVERLENLVRDDPKLGRLAERLRRSMRGQ